MKNIVPCYFQLKQSKHTQRCDKRVHFVIKFLWNVSFQWTCWIRSQITLIESFTNWTDPSILEWTTYSFRDPVPSLVHWIGQIWFKMSKEPEGIWSSELECTGKLNNALKSKLRILNFSIVKYFSSVLTWLHTHFNYP